MPPHNTSGAGRHIPDDLSRLAMRIRSGIPPHPGPAVDIVAEDYTDPALESIFRTGDIFGDENLEGPNLEEEYF